MKSALIGLALGFLAALPLTAPAALPQQFRSISLSKQFVIYCSDPQMRYSISSAAEEIKLGVLSVLSQKDQWKAPIVINVHREDPTEPGAPPSALNLVQLDQGFKIDLEIRLGQDLEEVHFQEQLVRAVLLEFCYRNHPSLQAGSEYQKPPEWIVQGIIQLLLKRAGKTDDTEIFKSIIDTDRLMPLVSFLSQRSVDMDSSSLALYKAYSLCLVTLLSRTNNGPYHLVEFLRKIPESSGDPAADLAKSFPDLGKSEATTEKWWTLNVARLASEYRFLGLSLEETDQRLSETLKLRLVLGSGTTKTVELAEFKGWIKEKTAQTELVALNLKLSELSANSHPLLRTTIAEYQEVVLLLARGKTRGIADRLTKLSQRRVTLAKLMSDIDDTVNWFEATQLNVKTGAFDSYLKKAKQWEAETPRRTDAISRCLDEVEAEME